MNTFFGKIKAALNDRVLRRRILFVFGILFIFRILATIPAPGIETFQLEQFFANNQFFGLLNIFSGGGLSTLSIVTLGVGPYITASIIMQLLTLMSPRLKSMYHEEGEAGKRKFTQYSRLLTVPLAIINSFGYLYLLRTQGVIVDLSTVELVFSIIVITAGSMLLMWLGELITEFGIGNGISVLIFAGIVASLPGVLAQLGLQIQDDPSLIPLYVAAVVGLLALIYIIVTITEAERPIPITHTKQVRSGRVFGGNATYVPLRVNQAGVIPIIFALSILLFPQMFLGFLSGVNNGVVQSIVGGLNAFYANQIAYIATYFVLVVLFTFFYTAVTFEPHSMAENLQKTGAFIPGVRPGAATGDYLGKVVTRLTLVGALFLGVIAVLPLIVQNLTGIQALAIGGTSLLIVVSVVIDIVKKFNAQLSMREY